MAGVAQAYGAASPMVHIGGAVPLKADKEAFHGVDDPGVRARDVQEDHQVERPRRAHRGHSRSHGEGLPHRAQRPPGAGARRAAARVRLQRVHPPGVARRSAGIPGRAHGSAATGRARRRALREAADGSAVARASPRARASSASARSRSSPTSRTSCRRPSSSRRMRSASSPRRTPSSRATSSTIAATRCASRRSSAPISYSASACARARPKWRS